MAVVAQFCDWLQATSFSQSLQNTAWVVPAVQTVHILAIAILMSSVVILGLRLLGVVARDQPSSAMASRFIPIVWRCVPVLLASGAILIVAEPGRSLQNPVFVLKMSLLAAALLFMLFYQRGVRSSEHFWDASAARQRYLRVGALVTLLMWVAIVCAGRWIAYVQ
jgi:hypothetical protein